MDNRVGALFQEQAAFFCDVVKLHAHAVSLGFTVSPRELTRTAEQQFLYVKQGRSQTMASNHLRSCAIDLLFARDGALVYDVAVLKPLGDFWESLHPKNQWGGIWKFKDVPHFERQP